MPGGPTLALTLTLGVLGGLDLKRELYTPFMAAMSHEVRLRARVRARADPHRNPNPNPNPNANANPNPNPNPNQGATAELQPASPAAFHGLLSVLHPWSEALEEVSLHEVNTKFKD